MGRRIAVVLCATLLGAIAIAGAGCGGGGTTSQETSDASDASPSLTTVKVGVLPIAALAPLYIGIDRGYFKDEGLKISTQQAAGGAALVPAVISGEFQFGYSNTASILLAAGKGLGLRIVSEGNQTHQNAGENPDTLVVDTKSAPQPQDLSGKRVAVNTLGGLTELATRDALTKLGVDTSTVKFVEVAFPDMLTALKSGRVAAAKMNEPFVTEALRSSRFRALTHPFFATLGPGASVSEYFTSANYAQDHPDVVARFVKALKRSLDYAGAHPDAVREIVPTYTKIPPDVAQTMKLDAFTSKLSVDSIDHLASLMVKYHMLKSKPDVQQLVGNTS